MNRLPMLGLLGLCSLIINVDLHSNTAWADELPPSRTSMFNEHWLDTVVSVEQLAPKEQPDGTTRMVPTPIGTGFIVETKNKHLVLITAKHVVADSADSKLQTRMNLLYRINQQEGPAYLLEDRQLEEKGRGNWFLSANHDIACRFLEWRTTSKLKAISQDKFLPKRKLQTGANLLVLDFPLDYAQKSTLIRLRGREWWPVRIGAIYLPTLSYFQATVEALYSTNLPLRSEKKV